MISTKKPIGLGIALSGGGYRSFLNSAGALAAMDERSIDSSKQGHLGGLLQSTSYISSLSGGAWFLMSMVLSDFKPVVKLSQDWDIGEPLLEGIPNLKQMEISRNDVQVLPVTFKDEDPEFYEKLNNVGVTKRDEGDFDGDGEDEGVYDDDIFEMFYQAFEHSTNENLIKRNDNDWFQNFKNFFTDLFQKQTTTSSEPRITGQNILPNLEFSNDLSLKSIKNIFNFYKNLHLEVRSKKLKGFPVSFTDYWGRALTRRIFPKNSRSPNMTFSEVMNQDSFLEFQHPFPIILSNLRAPGIEKTSVNSSIFEFTPFEFGSWDLNLFVNLRYLGSLLNRGKPIFHMSKKAICFTKFDNAGFITGTSSSLFNNVLIYIWQVASSSSSRDKFRAIKAVLNTFGLTSLQNTQNPKNHPDYALYSPNPFYHYGEESLETYKPKYLYMVDGGEDGQNIPFQPLLQFDRGVDVIFALDSTADTEGWPNGTILINTLMRYERKEGVKVSIKGESKNINIFPQIPSPEVFVKKGLNKKPVFFGCHLNGFGTNNITRANSTVDEYLPPIIGYFANTQYSFASNISTFRTSYEQNEVSQMIQNSYNIVSYANSTISQEYDKCVGCIVIKREFDRQERGLSLKNTLKTPEFCKSCYDLYCYN